jgi:hypothetical protein
LQVQDLNLRDLNKGVQRPRHPTASEWRRNPTNQSLIN